MSDFGLKIAVGIGDAVLISAALKNVKNKYDKIYIDIEKKYLNYKNNSNEYLKFYEELVELLFNDPKFVLNKGKSHSLRTMFDLHKLGIQPVLPRYSNILCDNSPPPTKKEYIVLTTKVRELERNKFNLIKKEFINTLNKLSEKYKIVLLGEREIEMNNEYKLYGNNKFYSIYNDIYGKVNNIIDLTIPKLGITAPDINNIKYDCSVMNKAKHVITIGCGGNNVLALAVAKDLTSYREDCYKFLDTIFNQSKFVTAPGGSYFIKMLKKRL